MSEHSSKSFDCVQSTRQIRDSISVEIAEMSYNELSRWLRSRKYSDPGIKKLVEQAAQQVNTSDFTPKG